MTSCLWHGQKRSEKTCRVMTDTKMISRLFVNGVSVSTMCECSVIGVVCSLVVWRQLIIYKVYGCISTTRLWFHTSEDGKTSSRGM